MTKSACRNPKPRSFAECVLSVEASTLERAGRMAKAESARLAIWNNGLVHDQVLGNASAISRSGAEVWCPPFRVFLPRSGGCDPGRLFPPLPPLPETGEPLLDDLPLRSGINISVISRRMA